MQKKIANFRSAAALALALAIVGCAAAGGGRRGSSQLPALPPGVTATLAEEEYAVFGRTIREIGESLRRRGPPADSRFASGLHRWRYTWDFEYHREPGVCAVQDVQIALESTIHMPRWAGRGSADPELGMLWDEYWDLLWMHEERHRAYAYELVSELHNALLGLSASDCGSLNSRIQAVNNELRAKYRSLNDRFDRNSGPGTALGPTWPPRR